MEIPKEKFAQLIKKAINIDEVVTQKLADEFKVSIGTLERWSEGESIPASNIRLIILQRVTNIMLDRLANIAENL